MAYTKQTWSARLGTKLNRFLDTVSGAYLELTSAPTAVTQAGTEFSVTRMNNIEDGIYRAFAVDRPITLTAVGWSAGAQTKAVTGMTATMPGTFFLAQGATKAQKEAFAGALMDVTSQGAGTLTFTSSGYVPTIDLSIIVRLDGE